MMTKYTFLLPAYKSAFFGKALESIKSQTFKDFRCLVSDDCSPENLRVIYDYIIGNDPRFSYKRNNKNIGGENLVSHWNLLVDSCDTEYLILASDDDIYDSNFLAEIDILTSKYPSVYLFRSRVQVINEEGEITGADPIAIDFETQIDFLFRTFVHQRFKCIANYVFKTSKLKQKGLFEEYPLAWGSDDITVMKMSENGVCITPSILFSFRMSNHNISNNMSVDKSIKKVQARIQNLLFFDKFINSIKSDETLLENNRLRQFIDFYYREWNNQILDGCEYLPYKQMILTYHFLNDRGSFKGVLHKLHLFWTWFKARNSR